MKMKNSYQIALKQLIMKDSLQASLKSQLSNSFEAYSRETWFIAPRFIFQWFLQDIDAADEII